MTDHIDATQADRRLLDGFFARGTFTHREQDLLWLIHETRLASTAAMQAERDALAELVGAAYVVVGILAEHTGLFDHPSVVRALDALSDQRETKPLLPWPHEPLPDALAARVTTLEAELAPKPKGTDCQQSPTGFHVVDTSMESGSNNCFHCGVDMRGYVPGAAVRPTQPMTDDSIWYRGWEAGYDDTAARYVKECWIAYKGGCDLDAPRISAATWDDLLDEIDAEVGETNDDR